MPHLEADLVHALELYVSMASTGSSQGMGYTALLDGPLHCYLIHQKLRYVLSVDCALLAFPALLPDAYVTKGQKEPGAGTTSRIAEDAIEFAERLSLRLLQYYWASILEYGPGRVKQRLSELPLEAWTATGRNSPSASSTKRQRRMPDALWKARFLLNAAAFEDLDAQLSTEVSALPQLKG